MKRTTCFVICPIGDEGTQTRRQSDCLLEYILKPALEGTEYSAPIRIDIADKPNHITTEIIKRLIDADLVICDLSKSNPNVFYELGIRHAYRKPCIVLADWVDSIPFDLTGMNIIKYQYDDPISHRTSIQRVKQQIEAFGDGPVSNPVSVALGFSRLSEEGDDTKMLLAALNDRVETLEARTSTNDRSDFYDHMRASISERQRKYRVIEQRRMEAMIKDLGLNPES